MEIQQASNHLDHIQQSISVEGDSDDLFNEEMNQTSKVNGLLARRHALISQKNRLQDGDRNSAFFHRLHSAQKSRASIKLSKLATPLLPWILILAIMWFRTMSTFSPKTWIFSKTLISLIVSLGLLSPNIKIFSSRPHPLSKRFEMLSLASMLLVCLVRMVLWASSIKNAEKLFRMMFQQLSFTYLPPWTSLRA